MQRISVEFLPKRKIVAENHWSIKSIRWIVDSTPRFGLWFIIHSLRAVGVCCQSWPIWWRFIAQDTIHSDIRVHLRSQKILKFIGPVPLQSDELGDFKYRLPFWWVLAAHANTEILQWAQRAGVDFSRRRDGVGFVYACLASHNHEALAWALQQGSYANDIDTRGNSLLAFALRRTSPEEDQFVDLLLSHGACWYYKGPLGENGEDVLKQSPEWTRWHLLRSLKDCAPQMTRSSRKM